MSVTPEDYKHSGDPESFTLTIDEDLEDRWVKVIGEEVTDLELSVAADERKSQVLEYVSRNPRKSENSISKGSHVNREAVGPILRELELAGKLLCEAGPRKAHLWSVVSAMTASG